MVNDLAPEGRRGETLSLYSLGVWGGLALGPSARRARPRRRSLRRRLARVGGLLPRRRARRARASRDASVRPQARRRAGRGSSTPRRSDPALVLVASAFGFAGFNAFVAAVRTRPRPGRRRIGVPRLLDRRRRDAHRRQDDSGPARAEAGLGARPLPARCRPAHDRRDGTRLAGLYAGTVVLACGHGARVPVAHDARGERRARERAQLGRRNVHRVHRARVRGRSRLARRSGVRGRVRGRLRRRRGRPRSSACSSSCACR